MYAWSLGIELASLRMPFRAALDAAAGLGAQGVEIDGQGEVSPRDLSQTALRQLRKILDERNLRVAAVACRIGRGHPAAGDLERRVETLMAVMTSAHRLGAPVVVGSLGRLPTGKQPEARRTLVEVLKDLGRHGARVGVSLALETGQDNPADLARLLGELPEGGLGVDLDPARLLLNDFAPLEAAATLGRWVLHVHASDARRGPAPARAQYLAAGQGNVHYPALLRVLEDHKYRGFLTVRPPQATRPVEQIAAAIEYLRQVADRARFG